MTTGSGVSLLDTADFRLFEWYVVYYPREPHYFWAAWLKQGFRHCDMWKAERFGPGLKDVVWLRVVPTFEILEAAIDTDPTPPWERFPGCTAQRVQIRSRAFKMRQWFHFGPITCTEIAKMMLGINNHFVRTPWQLFQYVKKRGGVLTHE